jgi:hypothetical protein
VIQRKEEKRKRKRNTNEKEEKNKIVRTKEKELVIRRLGRNQFNVIGIETSSRNRDRMCNHRYDEMMNHYCFKSLSSYLMYGCPWLGGRWCLCSLL